MKKIIYLLLFVFLASCSENQLSEIEIIAPESAPHLILNSNCDANYVFTATDLLNEDSYNPNIPTNCFYTQTKYFNNLEVYSGSDYGCFDIEKLRKTSEQLALGYVTNTVIGMEIEFITDFLTCGSGCGYFIKITSVKYYHPTVCAIGGGGSVEEI